MSGNACQKHFPAQAFKTCTTLSTKLCTFQTRHSVPKMPKAIHARRCQRFQLCIAFWKCQRCEIECQRCKVRCRRCYPDMPSFSDMHSFSKAIRARRCKIEFRRCKVECHRCGRCQTQRRHPCHHSKSEMPKMQSFSDMQSPSFLDMFGNACQKRIFGSSFSDMHSIPDQLCMFWKCKVQAFQTCVAMHVQNIFRLELFGHA